MPIILLLISIYTVTYPISIIIIKNSITILTLMTIVAIIIVLIIILIAAAGYPTQRLSDVLGVVRSLNPKP